MINITVEKTELAKKLEKELGISWNLVQQHPYDAGFDLRACIEKPVSLWSLHRAVIPIGLHFELEEDIEIEIRPRSGLAAKHGITVLNSPGSVDALYRKEVKVILHNSDSTSYHYYMINPGDRIAQACPRRINAIHFEYGSVTPSSRGGFGSTGNE